MLRLLPSMSLLAVTSLPVPAFAHAILLSSDPPDGGHVPAGPVAMQFRYNSRIDAVRSRLVLNRPDHTQTTLKLDAHGSPEVLTTRAELKPGHYVVRWQVLAIDGHITRGDVGFTVTAH